MPPLTVDNRSFLRHRKQSSDEILLVSWPPFATTADRQKWTLMALSVLIEIGELSFRECLYAYREKEEHSLSKIARRS